MKIAVGITKNGDLKLQLLSFPELREKDILLHVHNEVASQ